MWIALNTETRSAYLAELGKGIKALLKSGVEIVSWGMNDIDTSNRASEAALRAPLYCRSPNFAVIYIFQPPFPVGKRVRDRG